MERSSENHSQSKGQTRTAKEQRAVDRLQYQAEQRLIEALKREWNKRGRKITPETLQRDGIPERYVQRFLAAEV